MKETLGAFRAGIPASELPKSLGNAIIATRKLGLRYLWIDSLCIVQDDKKDKAEEISEMPQIYQNAYVTISAASAANCHDGFLHVRKLAKSGHATFKLAYRCANG
jgi:hypothetical protein